MGPAARIAVKLGASVVAMPLSIVVAHWIDAHESVEMVCALVFVIALACAFLYMVELRFALIEIEQAGWPVRIVRTLLAVPQAIGGLVTLCIGLMIIGWVLYNSFVERLPQYSGGFLTFGLVSMVLIGAGLLFSAFLRSDARAKRPPMR